MHWMGGMAARRMPIFGVGGSVEVRNVIEMAG